MQATLENRQARPRNYRWQLVRHCGRQMMAISGELLALASLAAALAAGLTVLAVVLG